MKFKKSEFIPNYQEGYCYNVVHLHNSNVDHCQDRRTFLICTNLDIFRRLSHHQPSDPSRDSIDLLPIDSANIHQHKNTRLQKLK